MAMLQAIAVIRGRVELQRMVGKFPRWTLASHPVRTRLSLYTMQCGEFTVRHATRCFRKIHLSQIHPSRNIELQTVVAGPTGWEHRSRPRSSALWPRACWNCNSKGGLLAMCRLQSLAPAGHRHGGITGNLQHLVRPKVGLWDLCSWQC